MDLPARPAPRWADVLPRALRGRCPVCGAGRIFPRGWRHAERCDSCGWRLVRGPGHWVGGNEIGLIITYPVCVLAMMAPAVALGPSFAAAAAGAVVALAVGLAIHRPARSLFFAIDYMIDPDPDGGPDDDGDDDGPARGDARDPRDGAGDVMPGAPPRGDGDDPRAAPRRSAGTDFRTEPIEVPVVPVPSPRPDPEPLREVPAPRAPSR